MIFKNWDDVLVVLNPLKKLVTAAEECKVDVNQTITIAMSIRTFIERLDVDVYIIVDGLKAFVKSICDEMNSNFKGQKDSLLKRIKELWKRFCFVSRVLETYFTSVNYLLKNRNSNKKRTYKDIHGLCFDIFRTDVFEGLKAEVYAQILQFFSRSRLGDASGDEGVRDCVELLKQMSPENYEQLEISIGDDCEKYYVTFSEKSLKQDSVLQFIQKCERAYGDERTRAAMYLPSGGEESLLSRLDKTLITSRSDFLLTDTTMVKSLGRPDVSIDLRRMCRLLYQCNPSIGEESG